MRIQQFAVTTRILLNTAGEWIMGRKRREEKRSNTEWKGLSRMENANMVEPGERACIVVYIRILQR